MLFKFNLSDFFKREDFYELDIQKYNLSFIFKIISTVYIYVFTFSKLE